jgi:hypothetical protein
METTRDDKLLIIKSLFDNATFVSFAHMEDATGLSRDQLLELKPRLEDLLRSGDRTISLTSVMDQSNPGFFLDSN